MKELYWILMCDSIIGLFVTLIVVSLAVVLFIVVLFPDKYENDYEKTKTKCIKTIKVSLIICIISVIGATFTPSTKNMLLVYGIGNSVEYLKNNEGAKELPDKCIKALDCWVESLTK